MDESTARTRARPTLYFLHAAGCPACAEMKPLLGQFYRAHRDRVAIVPVDLSQVEWKPKKWVPEATPTLIVRYPDGRLSAPMEGYSNPDDLMAWLRKMLR